MIRSAVASGATPAGGCLQVVPWSLRLTGGVNEVVKHLIEQMQQDGKLRPVVLISTYVQRCAEWDDRQSYATYFEELSVAYAKESGLRSLVAFFARLPGRLWRLRQLIRKERIEVIHVHYPSLQSVYFPILRALGLFSGKLLFTFHLGDAQAAVKTTGFERFLWKRLLRSADVLLSPSKQLHTLLLDIDPSVTPLLKTINNGVDLELFSQPPLDADRFPVSQATGPVVVSVGNFEERKGHQFVLRAFTRVRERFPTAILVMLGAKFPYMDVLEKLIHSLGLDGCAFLFANVPHEKVPAYLHRSTLFVLATQSETFPLSILEAGAAGLPVISTWSPGVPELVTDNWSGRLVPVDDVDALAENMLDLLGNPAEAARLAGNLRGHIAASLTWRHHYAQHIALYTRVST